MEKIFELALRNKFRFSFRGVVTTEDLWDLNLENLDEIYKGLITDKKKVTEESLLKVKSKEQGELDCKIEIIKHIVSVKLEDVAKREKAKERKEQKQLISSILKQKENEEFQNKSPEELRALLSDLDED